MTSEALSNEPTRCFVHYEDDGPSGPSGQACSITNPWSRLYIYEGADAERDAIAFVRFVRAGKVTWGRRNARITNVWIEEDGNSVYPGPIVQEAHRA